MLRKKTIINIIVLIIFLSVAQYGKQNGLIVRKKQNKVGNEFKK